MRLLILGGTVFLGRAVAAAARDRGHDVVCAARGSSGAPVDGVTFVRVDRDDPDGFAAVSGDFDALIDVARTPSHVRHAVAALSGRVGHAVFVSSCSVYSDQSTPGQTVETAPLLEPAPPEMDDPAVDAEAYGRCKVTCERLYVDAFGADRVFIARAGLIVGPEDGTGRFDYWIQRLARGGEVLAPGRPDAEVQVVDVRDLADWLVAAAERRLAGTFDAVGRPAPMADLLAGIAAGVAPAGTTFTWVDQDFLVERKVAPWAGPRSLPLWLPEPEYGGFLRRDTRAAQSAGLSTRPFPETAADTLRAGNTAKAPSGLTAEEETELLTEWRKRPGSAS